jgi:hypothetical protein
MSIRYKVFAPIAAALALGLALMGLLAWSSMSNHAKVEQLVLSEFETAALTRDLSFQYAAADKLVTEVMGLTDFVDSSEIRKRFEASAGEFGTTIAKLESSPHPQNVTDSLTALKSAYESWTADAKIILGLAPSATIPTSETMKRHKGTLAGLVDDVTKLAVEGARAEMAAAGNALVGSVWWILAVASLVTLGQRVHSVRTSPGAMDRLTKPASADGEEPETSGGHQPAGGPGDES